MATYPSSIKSFTNPSAESKMNDSGLELDSVISALNDEVNAIETELGTTPKAPALTIPASSAASVKVLLGMILQRLKDITNLTNWYDSFTSIPVAKGGTGATDAATALSNLGAAASGHNHSGVYQPADADLDTWAGKTAPSGTVVGTTDTQTLTDKRITKRIGTTTTNSAPTPSADSHDMYTVTALAEGATFGAPTGTPTNGQGLVIRVKDDGTSRSLAFNAIYRFSTDLAAPTATTVNKTLYLGFLYNTADSKWDCVAKLDNF